MDHFYLARNNNLNNLSFENLVKVNDSFFIVENNLNNLNFESLVKVIGTFSIAHIPSLRFLNVDNLRSLQTLNIENTQITTINLESLQTPVQPISIAIIGNQRLTNINLNNVTKAFSVEYNSNEALLNIQLDALTTIEDKFKIDEKGSITSIVLNNLTELKGESKIERNLILETFEANNLTKAEDLVINDNLQFTTLTLPNLSNLKSLTLRKLRLSDLSLEGLQNRVEPTSLFIEENPFLSTTNFGAMTIAKDVRFENNGNLTNLPISNLSKIESSLYIINCNNIRGINIENLTELNGDLKIGGNYRLEVFEANNIAEMGELYIIGYALISISMQNLRVVNKSLTIEGTKITNLDNFRTLNYVARNFNVSNNNF